MTLYLQDPDAVGGATLLESLLDACSTATAGGGAFAWATGAGLRLLLEDPKFVAFTARGSFDLVIGVDAVTNQRSLDTLDALANAHSGLTGRVFLHDYRGVLFHPKYAWFKRAGGGTLVVGSG